MSLFQEVEEFEEVVVLNAEKLRERKLNGLCDGGFTVVTSRKFNTGENE